MSSGSLPFRHNETQTSSSIASASHLTVAAWSHLPWLKAAFSTRGHGASSVYGHREADLVATPSGVLNLGYTPQDDPLHVSSNRRNFLEDVAGSPQVPLLTLKQIHSGIVHDLHLLEANDGLAGAAAPRADPAIYRPRNSVPELAPLLQGDGLVSGREGQFLGILTADCVPILLADTRTRVVGALHAGWRGTLARIVESGIEILKERHGSRPEDLIAAIGPAIRPCCFEVGYELQISFAAEFPYADTLFSRSLGAAKPHLDLQEANRRQLQAAGLGVDRIQTVEECTSCCRTAEGYRKYFSYRAENGITGRMMSVIGTVGDNQRMPVSS